MSELTEAILDAAKRQPPKEGDVIYVIRKNLVEPGNIPELSKIVIKCRLVTARMHGVKVVVIHGRSNGWDTTQAVFCTKSQHFIFSDYAEALEKAKEILLDVREQLITRVNLANDTLDEVARQLAQELAA